MPVSQFTWPYFLLLSRNQKAFKSLAKGDLITCDNIQLIFKQIIYFKS